MTQPEQIDAILADSVEHLRSGAAQQPLFVEQIRLRAQRRVLWMRVLWAGASEQGLAISHSEVDRILGNPARLRESEAEFYSRDETGGELGRAIDAADRAAAADPRWTRLLGEFGVSEPEADLLALAAAVEIDPWLRRVYGYLNDDATASHATPSLARSLFQWPMSVRVGADSALVRWLLARPLDSAPNGWTETSPWICDPHIAAWLTAPADVCPLDPLLNGPLEFIPAGRGVQFCLYPDQLEALREFAHSMVLTGNTAFEIELTAPEGAGKKTLAAELAQDLDLNLLVAPGTLLAHTDLPAAVENGVRAARLARLASAALYWRPAENVDARVWPAIAGHCPLTIIGSLSPLAWRPANTLRRTLTLPVLSRPDRIALWRRLAEAPGADRIPAAVSDWSLLPGEIAAAARAAGAGPEALAAIFRQMVHRSPGELFTPLICPYTWDDIILAENVREHLQEFETQARLRTEVYEEWGFERLVPLGRGITALFSGPSGTGKTMAAQVLARSLNMQLYCVDLAGVINKYIGETEKRLKQVFEACARANVVLFFDEADALFGQRSEVKDSHDRYANIQIDYLLQRLEKFDGIAILATNRKSDLDPAFLRRIRFSIDFLQPGPKERMALWRLALPARGPNGEELLDRVDWDFLVAKLAMSGADIKMAALGAAFRARSDGSRIQMRHILAAARRELTKQGLPVRPGDLEER